MKTREAVVLSAGIVLAAFIWGMFFYESKAENTTIRVVGNASKRFGTDTVKWRLSVMRATKTSVVSDEYSLVAADVEKIVSELTSRGIDADDIAVQPISTNEMFSREGGISGYRVVQSLVVITDKVDVIEGMAINPASILSKGIVVENSRLEYYYSNVDELKRELLGDASRDARMRAEEIAGGSGEKVGAIRNARAGVFQITEPYSTEVSGYGIYNTSSREKEIKVTVHAEFALE